ncbi:hypothetical protein F5X98DRAFT_373438 [Xylaria grammica]|nr:hypothetical protein F5X98DRAFT_373438 [Xylaria grammica]
MRLPLSFHQLCLAASLPILARAATCGTTTINSQEDARAARTACANITGDLVLGGGAGGEIVLDGITNIAGSLQNDGDSAITSVSSSTLVSIGVNATFRGLGSLQNIAFPNLTTVGTLVQDSDRVANGSVVLEDLPALATTNFQNLANLGEYRAISLPKWAEDECGPYRGDAQPGRGPSIIEVRDVALNSSDGLCILYAETNVDSITISGYAQPTIRLNQNSTQRISITSDGSGSVDFNTAHVGTANITGVKSLAVRVLTDNTIGSLRVQNSTFEYIDQYLRDYHPIRALAIDGNPNLDRFPYYAPSWFDWTVVPRDSGPIYDSIELRGVPALYLHPNSTHLTDDTDVDGYLNNDWYNGYCTTGRACMANMTSVVIEGNVTNDFFEDFIFAFWSNASGRSFWSDAADKIDIRQHGRVWERFEVSSAAAGFDCARLDRLRGVGLFAGAYSCNGETAPVTRDAWAAAEAAAANSSSTVRMFVGWGWAALIAAVVIVL